MNKHLKYAGIAVLTAGLLRVMFPVATGSLDRLIARYLEINWEF